jgi:chromosome segregation ATPase
MNCYHLGCIKQVGCECVLIGGPCPSRIPTVEELMSSAKTRITELRQSVAVITEENAKLRGELDEVTVIRDTVADALTALLSGCLSMYAEKKLAEQSVRDHQQEIMSLVDMVNAMAETNASLSDELNDAQGQLSKIQLVLDLG